MSPPRDPRETAPRDRPVPVSLRDQFAMAAMTGILAGIASRGWDQATLDLVTENVAVQSYQIADAMVKAGAQPRA